MKARLIAYTQPAPDFKAETDITDVQELIAYCARVSNPGNQLNVETSERLLNYLIKHSHWSPFEMCNANIELHTTRDIGRQILRHQAKFQEYSQRYADAVQDLGFEIRECRFEHPTNRQSSIEVDMTDSHQVGVMLEWIKRQEQIIELVRDTYRWARSQKIAKECCRVILPEGNTKSTLQINNTIRNWLHYCDIRVDGGTQKEHREVARAIAVEIAKIVPMFATRFSL